MGQNKNIKIMWIVEISAKSIIVQNQEGTYKRNYDVNDGWLGDVDKRDDAYIIGVKKFVVTNDDNDQKELRINFMALPVTSTSIFWKDIDKVYKVFSK